MLDTVPVEVRSLAVGDIWSSTGMSPIYRSATFNGSSSFYPVYRYRDIYSYSPFWLILHKGRLSVDRDMAAYLHQTGGDVAPPSLFIDRDIKRVGGRPSFSNEITDRDEFCSRMARAMQTMWPRLRCAIPAQRMLFSAAARTA